MSYVNPNIFEVDFANLTDWTDGDANGAVSEIDPAGQLHLDCTSMSADGWAVRSKDLGTVGTGNYYVEIKFKGDVWGGRAGNAFGIYIKTSGETCLSLPRIGNGFVTPEGDGIIVIDSTATFNLVYEHTWDNDWHTVVFYVHNSQTDMDIWIDKDPSETADVTDADCSYPTVEDGLIQVKADGELAGNGEYHIDYMYIGDALEEATTNATFFGSNF